MRIHWLLPVVLLPSATLAQPGEDNDGVAPGSGLRGSSQPAHPPRAEDGGFIAAAEWDADSDGLGLGLGSACSPYSGDDDNMCNLCTSQHGGVGDCFWCSEDNSCHDKGSIFYPSSCHADGCVQDGSLTDCTGTCAAGVVAGFDVPLAQCMMGIANATYYVGKDLDQAFAAIGIDSTQFQVMSDTTLNTQGVVIAHPKANAITVSFRGTVLTVANAKLDIDCTLQDYQTKVTSTQSSVTSGWKVANGFATAYLSLRSQMENSIAWALTQVGSAPKVYITGHSLGGAMATVMASEYLLGDTPGKFGEVQVLTIAAPRSGNPTYANGIDKMTAGKWWSIQNFYDQIPHLPPQVTGFQHVSNIIIVGPNDGNIVEVTPPMDDEHYNVTANPLTFHRTSSYMAQLNALVGAATGPTSCPTSVLQ